MMLAIVLLLSVAVIVLGAAAGKPFGYLAAGLAVLVILLAVLGRPVVLWPG